MNRKFWIAGVTALALSVSGSQVIAQNDAKPGKAGKEGKAGKGQRGQKGGPAQMQIKRIEQVLGTTLTDDQKKAVEEATKSYNESLAKAVGLTLDEWNAKQKEFRAKQAANGANKPKAN
jgi:hypothetical protein